MEKQKIVHFYFTKIYKLFTINFILHLICKYNRCVCFNSIYSCETIKFPFFICKLFTKLKLDVFNFFLIMSSNNFIYIATIGNSFI